MKYKWQILGGACTSVLMWGVLLLGDAFNEFILDESVAVSGIVFFAAPLALAVWYIVHVIRTRPDAKNLFIWHGCYTASFLPIWYAIYCLIGLDREAFIIPQVSRSAWLDLNGIEFILYGFSALAAFLAIVIMFHIVFAVILAVRKNSH